jgi:hypothetical protein
VSQPAWDAVVAAAGAATAVSGGIVYAGGGTPHQQKAGVEDTPEQMPAYLRHETSGAVSEQTLRAFCDGSVEHRLHRSTHRPAEPPAPTRPRSADAVR